MSYYKLREQMGTIFITLMLIVGVMWMVENLPWYILAVIALALTLLYFGPIKSAKKRALIMLSTMLGSGD